MHHSLPFYGRYQNQFLKAYMIMARFIRVPVLGRFVRNLANKYARGQHGGVALSQKEAHEIVEASDWVAIGECACRKTFGNCAGPREAEIIVGFGKDVYRDSEHEFRQVSKQEAKSLISECRQAGLTSIMMQCKGHYYAICNCCQCCCVPLRLKKHYGVEFAIIRDPDIIRSFQWQMTHHRH